MIIRLSDERLDSFLTVTFFVYPGDIISVRTFDLVIIKEKRNHDMYFTTQKKEKRKTKNTLIHTTGKIRYMTNREVFFLQ